MNEAGAQLARQNNNNNKKRESFKFQHATAAAAAAVRCRGAATVYPSKVPPKET